MSRKRILLIAAGALLVVILLAIYLFIKPTRQVSINFDRDNLSATISRRSGKSIDKVADINNSSILQLADGNYTIKTFSKTNIIKENTTNFTVKDKDTTVNIKTEYSQSFITSEVNKLRASDGSQISRDRRLGRENSIGHIRPVASPVRNFIIQPFP